MKNWKFGTFGLCVLAAVFGLLSVSCGDNGNDPDENKPGTFVAVTDITGLPNTATAGTSLSLSGTVVPDNATNKTIVWSVLNAETTGASISGGSTLNTTATGTVTVRATIINGAAQGVNFTGDFTIVVDGSSGNMVWIQPGTFQMGSPESEPDRYDYETQHEVTLTGFYMGRYQVTQEQYQAVMGRNPSYFPTSSGGDNPANRPVDSVSWYDVLVFCNKLSVNEGLTPAYRINGSTDPVVWGTVPTSSNPTWDAVQIVEGSTGYRLPTEAQWEYACRAGTTTAYSTGATISDSTGWYNSNSESRTHEVGLKPANAWGLYDMNGNVYDWCWDWFEIYTGDAQTDPTGAVSGNSRVVRGGSWYSNGSILRSAYRSAYNPYIRNSYLSFRLSLPAQ
jgi:formylglycine-generating enzyme required for sulfatase activity